MQARDLTEREADVLAFLLELEFPGVEALRRQAATAQVVGDPCPCGCATIQLSTDPAVAAAEGVNEPVAVAATGPERDDDDLSFPWLSLGVSEGRIIELEINAIDDTVFKVFPAPEEFEAPEVRDPDRNRWWRRWSRSLRCILHVSGRDRPLL